MNKELSWWEGAEGKAYAMRNSPTLLDIENRQKSLYAALSEIWHPNSKIFSVLEVGCGPGANLAALSDATAVQLYGVEPNPYARHLALEVAPKAKIFDGSAFNITAEDESFDLVFTAGVLIHINPEQLKLAMREIIRVSRKYVMAIEYFAPECEPIKYYGDVRIWRNDFGKIYLDEGLKPVRTGFFWKHNNSGYDNTVFWLMEKP